MLKHYVEICWLCIGVYFLLSAWNPITSYVIGALIAVLSIIKIFGA